MYDMQEDARIRAARSGDSEAMTDLIMQLLPFIRQKAASASLSSGMDAEDLAQEGLIGLLGAVRSFRAERGASFTGYACTCILNSMRSAMRRGLRAGAVPAAAVVPMEQADGLGDLREDPQEIVARRDEAQRLRQKLDELLSEMERQVLRMYLAGSKYGEIAAALGLRDSKAVDNALQRIRKKLKAFS